MLKKKKIQKKTVVGPCQIENKIIETKKVEVAELHEVVNPKTGELTDSYYLVNNPSSRFYNYGNFRYVLNDDGSLWDDGCLYLHWKVVNKPNISPSRLEHLASYLAEFKAFCDRCNDEGKLITDYLNPADREDTPTHRFRNYLINQGRSPSTCKRVMSAVCNFYEWMFDYNHFSTLYPLWQSRPHTLDNGKIVEVKDVCQFVGIRTRDSNSQNHINDGEVLRPLNKTEQIALIKTYSELSNPEYSLIFYIGLESKARKQTIMTLRLHHFVDSLPCSTKACDIQKWYDSLKRPNDMEELPIMIGVGHDADSKQGLYEAYPIYIHGWLWKRVIQYISSERAFARRAKALPQDDENLLQQYLFLTQRGHAMYHAKNDRYYNNIIATGLKKLHEGNAMDKWIDETLKSKLQEMGYHFDFHFHDVRATSAANHLENRKDEFGNYSNEALWASAIHDLMIRMNHSSEQTTYGYLRHLAKKELSPKAQARYEESIFESIEAYDAPKKKQKRINVK